MRTDLAREQIYLCVSRKYRQCCSSGKLRRNEKLDNKARCGKGVSLAVTKHDVTQRRWQSCKALTYTLNDQTVTIKPISGGFVFVAVDTSQVTVAK